MVKYTKEILEEAVKNSFSVVDVLRYLNIKCSGDNHPHISRRIKFYQIDTSHFKRKIIERDKKHFSDILVNKNSPLRERGKFLRRALIEAGEEYICKECKQVPIWNNKELILQVDHIDGNWSNNEKSNLRFLCPNCHTQTKTYGTGNLKKTKKKYHCQTCNKEIYRKSKFCRKCVKRTSKHDVPSCEELKSLILKENFKEIGRLYNVTDNAVRKWCVRYNLPTKREDILKLRQI